MHHSRSGVAERLGSTRRDAKICDRRRSRTDVFPLREGVPPGQALGAPRVAKYGRSAVLRLHSLQPDQTRECDARRLRTRYQRQQRKVVRMTPQLIVTVDENQDATVVHCSGRLTIEAGNTLRTEVQKFIKPKAKIVLDLTNVTHC